MSKLKKMLNKKLAPGSFLRNVVILMTGTTFAQALLILIAPILTRLYSPEDFGVLAIYTSILAIISVIICLRYELAIVLPEKDEDAANILAISILISLGLSLLVLVMVVLFREQFSTLLATPELELWLLLMPLSLVITGFFQALNYWSTRKKQFKRIAFRQITKSSITATTQISIGATSTGVGGLIVGNIFGQGAATARLTWQIWKDEGRKLLSYLSIKSIKKNVVDYKEFPIYSSWSSLLNTASLMMPPILLGYFFTPAVVGFYALGDRVLKTPMSIMGGAISKVFFQRATEANKNGDLDRVTYDIFKQLLTIGLVPLILIAIIAPDLFSLIFGNSWVVAGEYVRWLSVWIFFHFVSSPISTVFVVLGKQRELLLFNIILLITRISVLIIGGLAADALLTIKFFGITGGVMYFGFCAYILHIVEIPKLKVIKKVFEKIIKASPYVLLQLTVMYFSSNTIILVMSTIFIGIIFTYFQGKEILRV